LKRLIKNSRQVPKIKYIHVTTENIIAKMSAEDAIQRILRAKDYYAILDVPRDCSDIEIKKQYRKLALLLHPDKCSVDGCEEAFKKVSSAYKCLSSADDRKAYNMTGQDSDQSSMSSNPFSSSHMHGHQVDPEEIFRQFFAQQGGFPGDDNPFAQAAFGGPGIRIRSFGGNPFMAFNSQAFNRGGRRNEAPTSLELPPYLQFLTVLPRYVPMQLLLPVGLFCALYCVSILMQNGLLCFMITIFAPSRFKVPLLAAIIILNALGLWTVVMQSLSSIVYT
jgi:hypothetical protein